MIKRIGFAVILLLFVASYAYGAATLFPNPKFTAFDSNGDPLSGGKVYTYVTGTTTNKTTWTDAAKGTANANPVVLDSNGQADIWLDGEYRIVLKDSDDVTQWTVDNVNSLLTIAGIGTAEVTDDTLTFADFADVCTVDADTKLGDATNYTQIGSEGIIEAFGGTGRPAKTMMFRADAFEDVHANVTQGAAGGMTNTQYQTLEFDATTDMATSYTRISFFMPEDFDASHDCEVEIHSFSDTANAGLATVRVQIKTNAFGDADALDTAVGTAVAFNVTPDAVAEKLEITVETLGDAFAAGEWCVLEIARDGDDAVNDTFTGTWEVLAVVLRYWRSKLTQE